MTSNMFGEPGVLIDRDYLRIGVHLIRPYREEQVQPASYDVTLAPKLLVPRICDERQLRATIDLRRDKPTELFKSMVMGEAGFRLDPGDSVLAATAEQIHCPDDMICSVDGKSTLGRCWLAIHATAGFIDPGYRGAVTLEITNHGPWGFVLYPGMRIGQLRFHWLGKSALRPYGSPGLGSHYQGSEEVRGPEGI